MALDVRRLGRVDYLPTYEAMQQFTAGRSAATADQLWICEHPPVFTQGLAGKSEHLVRPGAIPVIATNRGGQVTFHGPGQVVAYPLIDLRRAGYFVKEYVYRIEEAVIRTLAQLGVTGHRIGGAPGIYVRLDDPRSHAMLAQRPLRAARTAHRENRNLTPISLTPVSSVSGAAVSDMTPILAQELAPIDFSGLGKIAALGIKVSRNCTYHGLAFNVAMDLEPFSRINPCGYAGLQTVDLSTIGVSIGCSEAAGLLSDKLVTYLAP